MYNYIFFLLFWQTIVWVELTKDQRFYYRAIYENRISDLLKGSQNSNIPNLRNVVCFSSKYNNVYCVWNYVVFDVYLVEFPQTTLYTFIKQAMELRKLCNHPYLCDGLEEHLASKNVQESDQVVSSFRYYEMPNHHIYISNWKVHKCKRNNNI